MSNKGVSGIIATILLVMIVIGLIGVAYLFFSGMISGKTEKSISLADAYCNSTHITIVLSNEGTSDLVDADITVLIDNVVKSTFYDFGTIETRETGTAVSSDPTELSSGQHTLLVTSPSNSVRQVVTC